MGGSVSVESSPGWRDSVSEEGCEGKQITRGGAAAEIGYEGQWGASVGSRVREDDSSVGC